MEGRVSNNLDSSMTKCYGLLVLSAAARMSSHVLQRQEIMWKYVQNKFKIGKSFLAQSFRLFRMVHFFPPVSRVQYAENTVLVVQAQLL